MVHIVQPCVNFINFQCTAFALVDPKSIKNTVKSSVSFSAFGIYERKSCTLNVDEIEPLSPNLQLLKTSFDQLYPKKLSSTLKS